MSALEKRAGDAIDAVAEIEAFDEPVVEPLQGVGSVYDVPVRVAAVLGKTTIDVASLLQLEAGSLIDLDRKVGDPIDLYVNDRLIARGELVMVDGALGVTMTEIVREHSE